MVDPTREIRLLGAVDVELDVSARWSGLPLNLAPRFAPPCSNSVRVWSRSGLFRFWKNILFEKRSFVRKAAVWPLPVYATPAWVSWCGLPVWSPKGIVDFFCLGLPGVPTGVLGAPGSGPVCGSLDTPHWLGWTGQPGYVADVYVSIWQPESVVFFILVCELKGGDRKGAGDVDERTSRSGWRFPIQILVAW